MAADNEAQLKLLLDIREAVQKLAAWDERWLESANKTKAGAQDATAGVSGLSAGIEALGLKAAAIAAVVAGMQALKETVQFGAEQLVESVHAAGEAELAQAKLEAVLRATGEASGLTTGSLLELATAQQRVTGSSDEEVQGVERVLLATKELSGNALPRAIRLTYDLAQQMGTDAPSAARLMAKAISEPDKAMEVFRRSGIALGAELDHTVTKLVEVGNTSEAQAIFFAALESRIGGVAEAAGNTLPGALGKLSQAVDDAREKLGAGLADEVEKLANRLEQFVVDHQSDLESIGENTAQLADRVVSGFGDALNTLDRYGVKLSDIPSLMNPLTAASKLQELAFRELGKQMGLSQEATTKLGPSSRSLATSLELLAAAQNAEAEAARAAALAEQDAALAREVAAGKKYAEQINAEAKAERDLRTELAGNRGELDAKAATLVKVIQEIRSHGEVNSAVSKNIRAETTELLDLYAKFGIEPPEAFRALATEIRALSTAQQEAKKSTEGLLDGLTKEVEARIKAQQAAAGASGSSDAKTEAQQRVDSLKREKAALEDATKTGVTTAEQNERLQQVKHDLTDAEIDLQRATVATTAAYVEQVDAAEAARNQVAELVNQYGLANGLIDEHGNAIHKSNAELLDAARNQKTVGDATEVCGDAYEAAGAAALGYAEDVDSTTAAVRGLAEHQHDGANSTAALAAEAGKAEQNITGLAKASEQAGPKIKDAVGGAREDAEAYEQVMIRLSESHLPKIVELVKEWKAEQGGATASAPN